MKGWSWDIFIAPGSALLVLPLVLLLGAVLAARDRSARVPVLRWWCAFGAAVALVAASKIAFYGWGTGFRDWDLTCFSGHTTLALAFWPVALALLAKPGHPARGLAAALGLIFGGLVGISRVQLGAHPPSEVVAGTLLGAGAAAAGLHALRRHRWPPGPTLATGLACLIAAVWLWRHPTPALPSERWFAAIGTGLSGRDGPVDRQRWRYAPSRNDYLFLPR